MPNDSNFKENLNTLKSKWHVIYNKEVTLGNAAPCISKTCNK